MVQVVCSNFSLDRRWKPKTGRSSLINVLASKGLITRDEVMREIKRLQGEMGKRDN